MLRIRNTCQGPVGVKKFEFLHHSAKLLHTKLKTFVWFDQQCFAITYTLFSAQDKIQMLTTACRIFTILLKSFLKSLGLYLPGVPSII
jgi:hypothetical protein